MSFKIQIADRLVFANAEMSKNQCLEKNLRGLFERQWQKSIRVILDPKYHERLLSIKKEECKFI